MKKAIEYFIDFRRRRARGKKPLLRNLLHNPASHHSLTSGQMLFGSANIIFKGFAYLMNNNIRGNYGEFGVYKGDTFLEAISAARLFGQSEMRFMAFDSFSGLPEIKEYDEGKIFEQGQFSFGQEDFLANLRKERVELERVDVYPGWFEQSLPSLELGGKFSFVYVDCDLYSSTVPVLKFLEDKLLQGALLVFDDWYCFDSPRKGVRRAVQEWLQNNNNISLIEYNNFHWAGKSFIVNFD